MQGGKYGFPPGVFPVSHKPTYGAHPPTPPFDPLTYGTPSRYYDARQSGTLWQDNLLTTPVAANGDPVGAWTAAVCSDGNSYGLTLTASGSALCIYETTAMNGNPSVAGDGVAKRLMDSGATNVAQPRTLYMVYQWKTVTANARLVDTTNATNRQQVFISASLGNKDVSAGSIQVLGTQSTNYEIFSIVWNGASSQYIINGASTATVINPGTNGAQGLVMFADRTGAANFANARMSLYLSYASAHSETTQKTIVAALNTAFNNLY
jgi:hypothetical protein